jgi:hypothetical protein
MSDRITEDGRCTVCNELLSEWELLWDCCLDCGDYPICDSCNGNGCVKCNFSGVINPPKENDI